MRQSKMTPEQLKTYLRYTNDKKGFIVECYEQATRKGLYIDAQIANLMWRDLQKIQEPENWVFDFTKYVPQIDINESI